MVFEKEKTSEEPNVELAPKISFRYKTERITGREQYDF